MQIAVIDDGVNADFFPYIGKLAFNIAVNGKGEITSRRDCDSCGISHGTICAAIIKEYAPKAQIGSIKIMSEKTHRGRVEQLCRAIEWCIEKNIKLVHMSIGSCLWKDAPIIEDKIGKLLKAGAIVVAALSNDMKFSMPACMDGVFGVKTQGDYSGDRFSSAVCGLLEVPFIASSVHTLIDRQGVEHTTQICNSYAAPLITARAHLLLEIKPDYSATRIFELLTGAVSMPSRRQRIANTNFDKTDLCDIPVIEIQPINNASILLAESLTELFTQGDYPSMAFVHSGKLQMQATAISLKMEAKKFIAYYADRVNLSAAFLVSDKNENGDMKITFCKDLLHNNRYFGDRIFMPFNFTRENIINAASYIIKRGNEEGVKL